MAEDVLWIAGAAIIGLYLAALLQKHGAVVASQHVSLVLGAAVLGAALGFLILSK